VDELKGRCAAPVCLRIFFEKRLTKEERGGRSLLKRESRLSISEPGLECIKSIVLCAQPARARPAGLAIPNVPHPDS